MATVSRVFQSPQCERSLAAASRLLQFSSASQEPAFCSHCFSPSLLDGIFFFNWKKQKLQSPHACRRHIQPCVPASRRCSPPLPHCAHQTKQRLLMLMLLGQSGLILPLLPPPLLNSITQPPCWEQDHSDHRPEPPSYHQQQLQQLQQQCFLRRTLLFLPPAPGGPALSSMQPFS